MPKKKKSTGGRYSNDPIDQAYQNLSDKPKGKYAAGKSSANKVVIVLMAVIVICAGVLFSLFFLGESAPLTLIPSRTIAEGVTVAGVDVGGMTREEATEALQGISSRFTSKPLVVTVLDRQWQLTPAESGAALDPETAAKEAFRYGIDSNPQLQVDVIPLLNLNTDSIIGSIAEFAKFFPTEGTQSGYEIIEEEAEQQTLAITIGTEYYDFDPDAFYDAVLTALNVGDFSVTYSCKQLNISTVDLDEIYAEHCIDVVDAILDPETHEVTQSVVGYRFDLDAAAEALAAAQPGDELRFPFMEVQPEMTTEQLQSMLFRDELGSYTAVSSSSYNRDTNLRLACEAINGIILYPGDSFSYNETLGERTPEKGYKPAASYLGNETVDTYGGGICQPSSSLYYAALIADLEIVQRSCHGFVSSYMPLGMDATVDWNGPDFKLRNNTDFPIRIDATANGGTVTVTLIGTDVKDYYVKMEYEVLGTSYPSEIEEIVQPGSGHYDGEVKTSAYTGYTVQTYKLKYSKETDELISREKEAYSAYSKRDRVVYRFPKEETQPTTEPTTEPATEPTTAPTTAPTTEPTVPPTAQPSTEPSTEATTLPPPPPEPTIGEAGGDVQIPEE